MMRILMILAFILAFVGFSCAQAERKGRWMVDGKPVAESGHAKSVKGFGAQLLVIRNPREFMEMWYKPNKPNFDSVRIARFDEQLGVVVLFAGCKPNGEGICNTEVDYQIFKPDGKALIERKKQKLWKEVAPPTANTHLGSAVLGFRTATTLAAGTYKVKAKVYDFHAEISFELETEFELK